MAPWAVPDRQALIQRIYDPPPSAGCVRAAGWKARPEARRSARETDDVVPEPRSPRQREREITNGGGVKYDRSKGQQRDTQGIRGRELAGCDDYPAGLLPHPIAAQAAGQVSLGERVRITGRDGYVHTDMVTVDYALEFERRQTRRCTGFLVRREPLLPAARTGRDLVRGDRHSADGMALRLAFLPFIRAVVRSPQKTCQPYTKAH
jgi:hypothetical protein